jgi:hypothetical protein
LNNNNKNVIITTILKAVEEKEREDDHFMSFMLFIGILCWSEWDIPSYTSTLCGRKAKGKQQQQHKTFSSFVL